MDLLIVGCEVIPGCRLIPAQGVGIGNVGVDPNSRLWEIGLLFQLHQAG